MSLPLDLFHFDLPPERIAQAPAEPRDASRLMHVPRRGGPFVHHAFRALPELLAPGDVLVVNRTRVIPARLHAQRPTGGKVELLLYRPVDGSLPAARVWEALGKPGSALQPGRRLITRGGAELEVQDRGGGKVRVRADVPLWDILAAEGTLPLPPYIARPEAPTGQDGTSYQTIFAQEPGAVAAPTASLHFTERVLEALRQRGVHLHELVLHVGPGTFLPIREEHQADVRGHAMHAEWYDIPAVTGAAVRAARSAGRRVIPVGTTSLRALETWARTGERRGESTLFVYPPFEFRAVDGLVTNFHLPRSTLMLLVSAMAGRERILEAYAEAIARDYRFFSYGDAMLLL